MKNFIKGMAKDFLAIVFVFLVIVLLFGAFDSGMDRVRAPEFNYHSTLGR